MSSVLSKMANVIYSLYLVRNYNPFKVRIIVFPASCTLIFPSEKYVCKILKRKIIKRINRQINWGMKVCYFRQKYDHSFDLLIEDRIPQAELFISKFSLRMLLTDIRHWETFENFKMFTSRL